MAHVIAMVIGLAGCALAQDGDGRSNDDSPAAAADYDQNEISRLAPALQACGTGLYCSLSPAGGATFCQSGSQQVYCCPSGYSIAGGSCLPNCDNGLSCGWNGTAGASVCSQSFSNTTQTTPIYCCVHGRTYTANGCQ